MQHPQFFTDLVATDSAKQIARADNAAATQAAVATANATDLPTAIALVNDLKTQFNALLAKLKTAGIVANS